MIQLTIPILVSGEVANDNTNTLKLKLIILSGHIA